ncbi:hypothetical protein BCV70DRAFT_155848 [Testicularia cyperi]|uniref:HSF-type DNA-binding domain-containing protein n=1 Tax=Testicularia cyperi TaxID=1882483 RepID=A0A317XZS9_9BASI|nr:hypothetical protein BCV70DRAFT_155848 [Testicularia cyperi]
MPGQTGPKNIGPLASSAMMPGDASPGLPLLGSLTPEDAQRLGLAHFQGMAPGASYSSAPQAFRPPINVSPHAFQSKNMAATPSPIVKPADVTPTPTPPPHTSTATSLAPVVAGIGTLPPTVAPAGGAGSSNYASGDSLRAIPTNKNNPAFLNKLRSMVDDPNTDELIRWSPDGSSFFVPNHVRFGDEVLPRFFKHNRFSSFVRQLNMYGFHKVPHLQQGALKHDSPQESELWEFSNPHFHRDHPEWLSKVQRKKGARDEKDHQGEREGSGSGSGSGTTNSIAAASTGQELMQAGALMRTDFGSAATSTTGEGTLQLASVLNAINAIKNAQSSISADLRHLQSSNQNLWQEAIESRQRAKRQQDTINKILRFLAGVFGNQDEDEGSVPASNKKVSGKGRGGSGSGGGRRVGVRPQQRKGRLMIEDASSGNQNSTFRGLEEAGITADDDVEIEGMPSHMRFQEANSGDSPRGASNSPSTSNGGSRFTTIGSPPTSSNDFKGLGAETVSTPGGSRRLSSQASNQVLNALASGEGNAWLASLFGASLANQGSKPTGPVAGGGLKLDPQMVAALQQALASASGNTAASENDYFGNTGANDSADASSRFSFASGSASPNNSGTSAASASAGPNSGRSGSAAAPGLGLDADALARIAGLSQALVQSPARPAQSAGSSNFDVQSGSPTKTHGGVPSGLFDSVDSNNNHQLALSLARSSRDLQNTSTDFNQVQNSINALIEGLQSNPNFLSAAGASQPSSSISEPAHADPINSWTTQGQPPNNGLYPDPAAPPINLPSFGSDMLSDPATAFLGTRNTGSALPSTTTQPGNAAIPGASASTNSATTGVSNGIDTDFDVDSFLSQFVDTSQAPGGGVTSPGPFGDIGAGGGNGGGMGESPSFAFSPATTAAFLGGQDTSGTDMGIGGMGAPGGGAIASMDTDSSAGSNASSSSTSPSAMWNMTGSNSKTSGKKRKPSTSDTTSPNNIQDIEMASRPPKKSVSRKSK